jgi:hypothetical protein
MAQEEITSEAVTTQAADWLSTALSIPMIWPRATAIMSLGVTALGITWLVMMIAAPAVPPAPPHDARRVAKIEQQVREAEIALRAQIAAGSLSQSAEVRDYSEAVFDPKHAEKHHATTRVHAD